MEKIDGKVFIKENFELWAAPKIRVVALSGTGVVSHQGHI